MKKNFDNIIVGLVVGTIFPPAIVQIFLSTTEEELLIYSEGYFENVCLLAIGLNAGLMWFVLNKFKMDKMGRGVFLTNLAYVIAFVVWFYI